MSGFEGALLGLAQRSSLSGVVLCFLALVLLWKQVIAQRPEMAKLEIGENGAIRAEYIAEMAALREELRTLRDENKSLRDEVRALHAMIDGMRREALTGQLATQTAVARTMGDAVPPGTRAAIERLDAMKGVGE